MSLIATDNRLCIVTEASNTSIKGKLVVGSARRNRLPPRDVELWPGFLFVFEGIDGSGKTSVCEAISILLQKEGLDTIRLREYTKESPWGIEIHERSRRGDLSPREELELFIRDREWHIENRIIPALRSGKIILLDRYFFATGAYQSVSTGIAWSEILRRNREEIKAPEPDIVFLLDIPANEGLSRLAENRSEQNVQFERLDRLLKVREAYLDIANADSAYFVTIDARKPLEEVISEVYEKIIDYMDDRSKKRT